MRDHKCDHDDERLEKALEKQGSGPYFNGAKYSLVDAACRSFKAWGAALIERRSTHSFPPAEFEEMYRANLKRRNKWVSHSSRHRRSPRRSRPASTRRLTDRAARIAEAQRRRWKAFRPREGLD